MSKKEKDTAIGLKVKIGNKNIDFDYKEVSVKEMKELSYPSNEPVFFSHVFHEIIDTHVNDTWYKTEIKHSGGVLVIYFTNTYISVDIDTITGKGDKRLILAGETSLSCKLLIGDVCMSHSLIKARLVNKTLVKDSLLEVSSVNQAEVVKTEALGTRLSLRRTGLMDSFIFPGTDLDLDRATVHRTSLNATAGGRIRDVFIRDCKLSAERLSFHGHRGNNKVSYYGLGLDIPGDISVGHPMEVMTFLGNWNNRYAVNFVSGFDKDKEQIGYWLEFPCGKQPTKWFAFHDFSELEAYLYNALHDDEERDNVVATLLEEQIYDAIDGRIELIKLYRSVKTLN